MNNLSLWVFRLMISLLLMFLALIVFLILAPDETPSELSARLRAEGNSAVGNYGEGFTYLMGIGAPAGADPSRLGLTRIVAYLEALSQPHDEQFEYLEKIPSQKLPMLYQTDWGGCDIGHPQCIAGLLANEKDLDDLISFSEEIFRRYQQLLRLQNHENSFPNRFDAPAAHMQFVAQGNFALIFRAIKSAIVDPGEHAASVLMADIARHRELLAQANTIIAKIVHSAAIERTISVLNALQILGLADSKAPLPEMSKEERSLAKPLAWEFAANAVLFDELAESKNLFSFDFELPEWTNRAALKKNKFLNRLAVRTQYFIDNSERYLGSFSTAEIHSEIDGLDLLINPVGSGFIRMADDTNYDIYNAMTQNLSKQILLFNQIQQGRTQWAQRGDDPMGFYAEGETLVCFDRLLPRESQSQQVCLLKAAKSEPSS